MQIVAWEGIVSFHNLPIVILVTLVSVGDQWSALCWLVEIMVACDASLNDRQ